MMLEQESMARAERQATAIGGSFMAAACGCECVCARNERRVKWWNGVGSKDQVGKLG